MNGPGHRGPGGEPKRTGPEPARRLPSEPVKASQEPARPAPEANRAPPDSARPAGEGPRTPAEPSGTPGEGPRGGQGRTGTTDVSQAGPVPFGNPVLPSMSEWPPPAPDSPRAQFEQDAGDEISSPPVEAPRGFAPEDALDAQIRELEAWAASILRRNHARAVRFWLSRGAAFIAATTAVVAGLLGAEQVLTAAAAVTALGVAVVAAFRVDGSQRPHRRAVRDLRELQNAVKLRWDKVRLSYPDPRSRKRIAHALALLEAIQSKREEIGRYLGSSEPSDGLLPRRGSGA